MTLRALAYAAAIAGLGYAGFAVTSACAEEPLPWRDRARQADPYQSGGAAEEDVYDPNRTGGYGSSGGYGRDAYSDSGDAYRPPAGQGSRYDSRSESYNGEPNSDPGYGEPYSPPPRGPDYDQREAGGPPPDQGGGYEQGEIIAAGHRFFGSISQGLASAVEYAFQSQGRPNGYILGEDAGGAIVLGLRYGEGTLYTKDAGSHKVFWQGPSLGYDAGAEGSKTMVLVYNLRDPAEIYDRFAGVQGAAYLVGASASSSRGRVM